MEKTIEQDYIDVLFSGYYYARMNYEDSLITPASPLPSLAEIRKKTYLSDMNYYKTIITDFMTNKSNEDELRELAEQYFEGV